MIKSDKGIVEVEGSEFQLYIDFCLILKAFADKGVMSQRMLERAVHTAFLSEEELDKQSDEALKDIKSRLDTFRELVEMIDKLDKNFGKKNVDEDTFKKMFGDLEDK